jgi:hypothetical protein
MHKLKLREGRGEYSLDQFTHAYLVCALWASSGPDTEPHRCENLDGLFTLRDFAPEAIERAIRECEQFQRENSEDLTHARGGRERNGEEFSGSERAGHDLFLTRNGHGAGYWDGDYPKEVGERLTEAAHKLGEVCFYPGDDGFIYC